jgi:hypothetical protein
MDSCEDDTVPQYSSIETPTYYYIAIVLNFVAITSKTVTVYASQVAFIAALSEMWDELELRNRTFCY